MLNDNEIASVKEAIKHIQDNRHARRLQAILHHLNGLNNREIAKELKVSTESVRRWVKTYHEHGIHALSEKERTGRPTVLTPSQRKCLLEDIKLPPVDLKYPHPLWTVQLLQDHVWEKYRVNLSRPTAHRILSGTNIRVKKIKNPTYIDRKKHFENSINQFAPDQDFWYIDRFLVGKFPVGKKGPGKVRLIQPHYIFCALQIDPYSPENSEFDVWVTLPRSPFPNSFNTFFRFVGNIADKTVRQMDEDNIGVIVMQNLKWERSMADCWSKQTAIRHVRVLFTPWKSHSYKFKAFEVMKTFILSIKKWALTAKLDSENTRDEIRDHAIQTLRSIIDKCEPQNF